MRILAIADIHGAAEVYEWLPGAADGCCADMVILGGDLLVGGWEDEQSEQASKSVIPLLRKIPAPVYYIMGNDDHVDLGHEDDRIKPLHGRRLDFGNYGIIGYQYSTLFVGGCFEKSEDEIAADLRQLEPVIDEHTILVTHMPAHGYVDRTFSGEHVGSRALEALVARTGVLCHIHGHIHDSFGRAGNHFKVAAGGKRRAMTIEIPSLFHSVIERP